ncbi:hypothetical protein QQ045_006550 [Rhodiola kirilowii]
MRQGLRWMKVAAVVQFCCWSVVFSSFFNEIIDAIDYEDSAMNSFDVRLIHVEEHGHVIVDNGICRVTITIPDGTIVGIKYGGIDNLLYENTDGHGYWDADWERPGQKSSYTKLNGVTYSVIKETGDQVELSFRYRSDPRNPHSLPFGFDKRFVMLRGVSGFYSYAVYDRPAGSVDLDLYQTRITFKLNPTKFTYMALSDNRRRFMPTVQDRITGKKLAYKEAVLLTHAANPDLRGKVDDKYMYSAENKDINVHGWISTNPGVGFWVITPSHEFIGGGPMKQDLTSHVGPVSLAMFMSTHYAGEDITTSFRNGEPWKKVFGPVFVYLNSNNKDPTMTLWDDAKRQMLEEVRKWPYTFPLSPDFLHSNQRGTVIGHLQVHDRFMQGSANYTRASEAYVGLAAPGAASSWQRETKEYQFWVRANGNGDFVMKHVLPGTYNLYAWLSGFLGEYVSNNTISVTPGGNMNLGLITFELLRDGPTLWEIGIPDRTAAEFYIPDPDPRLTSGLYSKYHFDMFREYGLWDRYSELYPKGDLTYDTNHGDYRKDWFFAQVTRKGPGGTNMPTTWKIIFTLPHVSPSTIFKLRISIASATYAELQVQINDPSTSSRPHFTTGLIGRDNSIARHGNHGLYRLFNIDVPGAKLVQGSNTIYLTQPRTSGAFVGFMYDYIRLEGHAKERRLV